MPTFTSSAVVNILGGEDSSQQIPINRGATVSLDAIFGQYGSSKTVVVAVPVVEQIPNGKAFCYFIRNLNAPAGASIDLAITQTGGAVQHIVLGPGDFICQWAATNSAAAIGGVSQGITALTVTSGAGTSVYEIYLGG